MPITINGTGSISGLSAGGLPDLTVVTADIADDAVTAPKLNGSQSGSAPIFAARAWVNFNGTGTVAIRASGNVSSITDNGVGSYTVNFTTAMPDANYAVAMYNNANSGVGLINFSNNYMGGAGARTTTGVGVASYDSTYVDSALFDVVIFR